MAFNKKWCDGIATLLMACAFTNAAAVTINLEDLQEGATLSNQYTGLGVRFSPNAFVGAGGPTGAWATNTDMTVTSGDIGDLGSPGLVSGNVLRALQGGWFDEDGDPSFQMVFLNPISFFSIDFAGVANGTNVKVFVYFKSDLITTVFGPDVVGAANQFTLLFSAASITSLVVTPGSFDDWVAVDNFVFTPLVDTGPPDVPPGEPPATPPGSQVPEPNIAWLLGGGLLALSMRFRKRRGGGRRALERRRVG